MQSINEGGQIFHAHPDYRKKGPWRDWVKIDWGRAGNLPAQIWGFFQLKHFLVGSIQQLPELDFAEVYNGTFAIIENADYMEEGAEAGEEGLF